MTENGQELSETIKKPKPKLLYDYNECAEYLQEKYNFPVYKDHVIHRRDENTGKWSKSREYCTMRDFWVWVTGEYDVTNPSFTFNISDNTDRDLSRNEPWALEIFSRFIDEFGDGVTFLTDW